MKKKPKITIFHCGFIYTGGGERIVIEEVLGLRRRGFEVECFAPTFDPKLSYPDIIGKVEVKTILPQLPSWFPLHFAILMVLTCLLSPFFAFRFRQTEVFFGANQPGAFLAWVVAGILGKPYLAYLNQPNRVLYPRDNESWQNVKDYYFLNAVINKIVRLLVVYLDKKSITSGQKLLINGRFVAQEICRVYNHHDWVDCPGGAHPAPKSVLGNNRLAGKVKVNGVAIDKPYLLLTSRHEPWKRFDWAIEVTKQVAEKYPQIKLVIPGPETAATPKLRELAKSLGISKNVIFLGVISQKDLGELYRHACVYVFPSPKEDLGVVVEEAQAAGVPVVAWNFGGPTVTVKDGQTGFLAKPYDLLDFTQKIIELLEHPEQCRRMGEAAWQHVKDHFSWDRHLDILEREILAAPSNSTE